MLLAYVAKRAVKFFCNGDRSGAVLNKYTGRNLKNCSIRAHRRVKLY